MKKTGFQMCAVCAGILSVALCNAIVHADDKFVQPGPPQIDPNKSLAVPSFDHLIPTITPVIQTGSATVHPSDNVTNPVENPVIPKGAH